MINAGQIRAARALLKWNQSDLAERSGVSVPAIANIELEKQQPSTNTLERLEAAFNKAGLEFTDRDGIRRKDSSVQILQGQKGFMEFYGLIYDEIRDTGNTLVCVGNVDERPFIQFFGDKLDTHFERIRSLNVRYQILIRHGDTYFPSSGIGEYRWAPQGMHYSVPYYLFGNKLAFVVLKDDVKIFIISEPDLVDNFAREFQSLWDISEAAAK